MVKIYRFFYAPVINMKNHYSVEVKPSWILPYCTTEVTFRTTLMTYLEPQGLKLVLLVTMYYSLGKWKLLSKTWLVLAARWL